MNLRTRILVSVLACVGLTAGLTIAPAMATTPQSASAPTENTNTSIQSYAADPDLKPVQAPVRGSFTVYVKPPPAPVIPPEPAPEPAWVPPRVTPDPGSAQAIAHEMVLGYGWSEDDFGCLVALWNRESGWRVNAHNEGSGAYGIAQALPGSKMASAGADWETNPVTQIKWGLDYIKNRYGTPCGAWEHSEQVNWY